MLTYGLTHANTPCRAKQDVQPLIRQRGRGLETTVRVVPDGEDGMRSIAGKWFNANEQQILDWSHIARRFEAIGKGLIYLPHVEDFKYRLSRHWHHLNRAMWKVWHGNLYGASIALNCFYDAVAGRNWRSVTSRKTDDLGSNRWCYWGH